MGALSASFDCPRDVGSQRRTSCEWTNRPSRNGCARLAWKPKSAAPCLALIVAPRKRDYDPDYLSKKRLLPKDLQLELDLIEERIVTDPTRTYQRRYLTDGVLALSIIHI